MGSEAFSSNNKSVIDVTLFLTTIFVMFFISLEAGAVEIEVHETNLETDLAKVKCFSAIMSMSGSQKTSWWHFLPYLEACSDQAFIAYMISNFTRNSSGACDLKAEVEEKGRLSATRAAAVAEYSSTEKVESIGKVEINMWALAFACLDDSPSCSKFTPVVLREVKIKNEKKPVFAFFSLWERDEAAQSVRNSITARILELPMKVVRKSDKFRLRVLSNDHGYPELCEGLSMPDEIESNTTIFLNSSRFTSKIKVKVAAEAAGFSLMSKSKDFCVNKTRPLCLMGIETSTGAQVSELLSLNLTSAQTRILLSFMYHVKQSYIQAQNSALQLNHPGTDFWMAAIALPSAIIAVLIAAVPFINMQLRLFQKLKISNISHQQHILILCVCNTVLSAISYSAAVALIPSELQKEKSFKTWGLLADQVPIDRRLQILLVVKGKSTYFSRILLMVVLSLGLLLPAVACITVYRCKKVFWRLRVLQDLRELKSEHGDEREMDPEQTREDNLQAIEMTKAEAQLLEKKLVKLRSLKRRASLLPQSTNSRGAMHRSYSAGSSRSPSDL